MIQTGQRNVIPGLKRVDWSDVTRQSEFVHSVISALGALGEMLDYDTVCAVSGAAFRTSHSIEGWDFGNYQVKNVPITIEHTFRMLGYSATLRPFTDFVADCRRIVESIDKGVPVVTLDGIINHSDCCVVSGYDDAGKTLLGYSAFMDIKDEHPEEHDETGYFRKTNWHSGQYVIIDGRCEKPDDKELLAETLKLASRLIEERCLVPDHDNGMHAHKPFANALLTYDWDDNWLPYMNVMCNYKQYLDRHFAAPFFRKHGRVDLADRFEEIAALCTKLGQIIPQDFTAADLFSDRENLKPYCDVLLQIAELEERLLPLLG